MKKIPFFIFLTLLLGACNSNADPMELDEFEESEINEMEGTGNQIRNYNSAWSDLTYRVSFDGTKVIETTNAYDTYHVFEIQGGDIYPGYMEVTTRKMDPADLKANEFLKIYYAPMLKIPEVSPVQIGENQVYLFQLPEFSSYYTEFAVIIINGEAITVALLSGGLDQTSIDADRTVFMDFLRELRIN